jgi:hypothetical protein
VDDDGVSRRRVLSLDWWLRDRNGRLVVAQWPNVALWVWIAARLLTWTGALASHRGALSGVARGALIVWALDELVRGVNPFRRVLGAVVVSVQLASLA